jgi:archaemetzincin
VKIAIVPIGMMAPASIAAAERCLRQLFGCDVERCQPIEIPVGSFDARRRQYSSVAFMLALARGYFGAADRILGLTGLDLFIPMLTFVFGQAQLGGRCALVSLARLEQQFYGATPDSELLQVRAQRELGHELGHSFGLIHCPRHECLMSLATSIQDVDRRSDDFCQSCRRAVDQEVLARVAPGTELRIPSEERNESKMADPRRR